MALNNTDKKKLEQLAIEAFQDKSWEIRNKKDAQEAELRKNPPKDVAKLFDAYVKAREQAREAEAALEAACYRIETNSGKYVLGLSYNKTHPEVIKLRDTMENDLNKVKQAQREVITELYSDTADAKAFFTKLKDALAKL